MASISLTSNLPLVFLGSDSFYYEKTSKTYFNVNLFDRSTGQSLKLNTNEKLFKDLSVLPALSSIICTFDFDVNYKNLRLTDFLKVEDDQKKWLL